MAVADHWVPSSSESSPASPSQAGLQYPGFRHVVVLMQCPSPGPGFSNTTPLARSKIYDERKRHEDNAWNRNLSVKCHVGKIKLAAQSLHRAPAEPCPAVKVAPHLRR